MNFKMNYTEFREILQKGIDVWGEGKFNRAKSQYIFESVNKLTKVEFEEMIHFFIMNNTYAPMPKDFYQQTQLALKRRVNYGKTESNVGNELECSDCYDTGYMSIRDNDTSYETYCRCPCTRGTPQKPKIALWSKYVSKKVTKRKFDHLWFKPSASRPFDLIKEEWKETLMLAEGFWEQKRQEWRENK